MRSELELVRAANHSFVGSYRTLVGHCAEGETVEIGGVFAFVTGIPLSLFNGCIVVEPASSSELETAMDWIDARSVPHRVFIAEPFAAGLGHVPLARGFQRDDAPYPGMVLHPAPDPPAPPAGVTVVPVTVSGLDAYVDLMVESGMGPDAARQLFSPSFAADPGVQLFLGTLDGQAVGNAVAIRSGDVSGVYAVGTRPAARRRGVGTALTWAAVAAGRAWGCDTIVLQASEMGYPIYEAMGFRTVVSYWIFGRPVSPDRQ